MSTDGANISLSDQNFRRVVEIAACEAGLAIPETKKSLVQSRIARRMRLLGQSDCGGYLDSLSQNSDEKQHFISALTTNVSHFFREKHHFETLTKAVLSNNPDRLRLWSAGCSNGQEPYSLAIQVLKTIPDAVERDILILATDIDDTVLRKAKAGRYTRAEIDGVPEPEQARFFSQTAEDQFEAKDDIRKLVRFNKLNLNGTEWPMKGLYDAIFCRNVVIYFSDETQSQLWPRFRKLLKPEGMLFLGHSERIHDVEANGFRTSGVTTYTKT